MHPARELYHCKLKKLLPPIKFAFAYGSAVFQQQNRPKGKMLDLVFAVDDPVQWHTLNLRMNPAHYSGLRWLGPNPIAAIQRYPAAVYYNTLVKADSQTMMKYGVVSVEDLCDDLVNWRWLYASGRLHKPVVILEGDAVSDRDEEDPDNHIRRIQSALTANLKSASLCSVLLLSSCDAHVFTAYELFTTVAGLSYKGDFRMLIGEDKRKVDNIVKPLLKQFEELYSAPLQSVAEKTPDGLYRKRDRVTLETCFDQLPLCVRERVTSGATLQSAISSIVMSSSIRQSLKGILTAGVKKTIVYSAEKIAKMLKSMRT